VRGFQAGQDSVWQRVLIWRHPQPGRLQTSVPAIGKRSRKSNPFISRKPLRLGLRKLDRSVKPFSTPSDRRELRSRSGPRCGRTDQPSNRQGGRPTYRKITVKFCEVGIPPSVFQAFRASFLARCRFCGQLFNFLDGLHHFL
jgi:hypothetical protein